MTHSEEKKEQIALKALELFLLNGYNNVSISDLQNALDIGRGTMYYYFKDKEDLFFYVMTQFFITPKRRCMQQPDTILQQLLQPYLPATSISLTSVVAPGVCWVLRPRMPSSTKRVSTTTSPTKVV